MKTHLELGKKLSYLRDDGILIIGSGALTHNLRERHTDPEPAAWAIAFTDWVYERLSQLNDDNITTIENDLINIMSLAPNAERSHPRTEHLVPIMVAFGAAIGPNAKKGKAHRVYNEMVGKLSLDSYLFE